MKRKLTVVAMLLLSAVVLAFTPNPMAAGSCGPVPARPMMSCPKAVAKCVCTAGGACFWQWECQ